MLKGRSSGLLLPIFSLPGDYGIGTLGSGARQFIDFLAQARQHTWQILPLVPPGSGDSPYMSPSAFAGNPWLLDLEEFVQRGLLTHEELNGARYPQPDRVDYDWLRENRPPLLRTAWKRDTDTAARAAFLQEQADWLPDHALFSAIHEKLGLPLDQWPHDIRCREPDAMERWGQSLSDEVDFQVFLQYHFFRQWRALKTYANQKGIAIMGDLPIYVSADSVEVWSQPQLFQMDADFVPTAVAGVPPDAFSDVGQYWGNPLYDWAGHKKELFSWWTRRLQNAALLYDRLRIDHFRGFHTYWAIPASSKVAKDGKWEKGPGQALLDHFAKEVPQLELIAEDLGVLDDDVWHFIHNSGIPGMKILVFAFDPNGESSYLPHNCPKESVVYTGTHDTPTFVQWLFDEASPAEREFASDYLRLRADEGFGWGAICGAWMSPSALAIAPLQDVLGLGADARVNFPGTTGPNNWSWRVRSAAFNGDVSGKLAKITRTYRRG
ncbi:4-alpha-glucanotransferase [Intestinimonas butyriciproducens]|uniref:4-alpha-glucanotransferase n=1 Tax=Intestinimonas butyriciproducens TaxID=1297617 RepID=UPI00195B40BE|nr:4-alpha-glucanotransferase [Intestinimonas butyriciproducens]MBM6976358.1 4-alpha-glucanotransferase [Intestinimonas butyriciproducens]